MQTSFFFFFFVYFYFYYLVFLFLSCAPHHISCTSIGRRILHQPFFPLDSIPPSEPPSRSPPNQTPNPNPKYPFSTATPNKSPFFPSYPAPPPPPSPASFASFPANISSLILPHTPSSKPTSQKVVALAVSVTLSVVLLFAIVAFFFYRRRRNRHFDAATSDDKTFRSDNSSRLFPANGETAITGTHKLRGTSGTSSEFLYLGTLVNSRAIEDSRDNVGGSGAPKMDSPELRPLPPLARQSSTQVGRNGDDEEEKKQKQKEEEEEEEEEDEEFYSPRVSSGGTTGSGSRRVFAAAENFEERSCDSGTCSYSSSSTASPARSQSISLSPPVSLSPRRSQPKSPESTAVQVQDQAPPPHLQASTSVSNVLSSSPSETPDRGFDTNPDASLRVWNTSSPLLSSPSETPDRIFEINPDASLRVWNASSPLLSSQSSTPDRDLNENLYESPRLSNVSDQNTPPRSLSPLSSSSSSSSDSSPRISNVSDLPSSPPKRSFEDKPVANLEQESPVAVTPPPPPPPPPPPFPQSRWETSKASTPIVQSISKPPVLIPPSRPFVLQNPTNVSVSPVELPPSFTTSESSEETPKLKLKPLHWDKVRASSDREMVWDHLRSSSFKLNEEMIETLFVVKTPNSNPKETTPRMVLPSPNQENRVLDPKKSQNIAISLRALNVTVEEVCEALVEGNAETLGTEMLESLLKMAPTKEEERKLKECKDDSPIKLGPAERFLKVVLDVPFAFKRVDAMLYIANFESEVEYLKKSFETLEAACEELRNSRMFLKLLEAVLKTGNRMNVGTNRGDAHAFKLDTLLKLVDVKGADGKTTLLHFVVQEIIRTEGARPSGTDQTPSSTLSEDAKCRKLGLQVVSSLSSDLTNVKKAAAMDSDVLSGEVSRLSSGIGNISEVVRLTKTMGSDESSHKFSESMNKFMKMAEEEIYRIQAQESVALSLVKEITEYFHGNSAKEEAHPFRIFLVVRDFLTVLDRVCKEVGMINERTIISSAHKFPVPVNPMLPQVFPGFQGRRQYSFSEDEIASP